MELSSSLKQNALKLAVVLLALGFIINYVPVEMITSIGSAPAPSDQNSGRALFHGMIRTYDPFLLVAGEVDQDLIDDLRLREGVMDVRLQADGLLIITETRDEVYPIGSELNERGYEVYAVANLIPPSIIEFDTLQGKVNASSSGNVLKLTMVPFLEADSQVPLEAYAQLSNGRVAAFSSVSIVSEEFSITIMAPVVSLDSTTRTYGIPFQDRDLDTTNLSLVSYERSDYVLFDPPLSMAQIMDAKASGHFTYIEAGMASVPADFTNASRIEADLEGAGVIFPDSVLVLEGAEPPDLPYESTSSFVYSVMLPDEVEGYASQGQLLSLSSSEGYDEGQMAPISLEGIAIDGRIVFVRAV